MKKVTNLILPNQAPLHLSLDLDGNVLMQFQDKAARLTPRQAHDLGVMLLQASGAEVHERPLRDEDIPGNGPLKANLKIV